VFPPGFPEIGPVTLPLGWLKELTTMRKKVEKLGYESKAGVPHKRGKLKAFVGRVRSNFICALLYVFRGENIGRKKLVISVQFIVRRRLNVRVDSTGSAFTRLTAKSGRYEMKPQISQEAYSASGIFGSACESSAVIVSALR
jgi:hypothetical protein